MPQAKLPKHINVLKLISTAKGHLSGIEKMIKEDRYCIDISNQLLAVISILKKANLEVLKKHMETCIRDAVKTGEVEQKIEELKLVLQYIINKG